MADSLGMSSLSPTVEQAIYGYHGGHRKLATSTSISESEEARLLALSDPQVPRSPNAVQLTGSPLGAQFYALIMTWPATDMPRPGSVWSHALLIPLGMLGEISDSRIFLQ